jgi:hypothetical protein
MSSYQSFIFESYHFSPSDGVATFVYGYDDQLRFTETFTFDFAAVAYDQAALDRALQLLFFMAGISYYKMYLAPEITINMGQIDEQLAAFLNQTYQRGLGEFCYVNQLPLITRGIFVANAPAANLLQHANDGGSLIGLGGGKDSLVSVELLRSQANVATWSVGHKPQLTPLVARINLPHYWVERAWDPNMLKHNDSGAYNGHVPISAILACAGVVALVLSGKRDVVVSNEQSANEATLEYNGVEINHQYSKSQHFEAAFQVVLQSNFGDSLRYYSLLRPFSELKIAELFSATSFDIYHDVFSSCNQAFTHGRSEMFWDGSCPKCAFVFLALTPFVERAQLEALFSGKNLLLDSNLTDTYKQLLGISGDKPLECVGEIKESRAAMQMAQQLYPELAHYIFELPADYDYAAWQPHSMPSEVFEQLQISLR